MLGRRQFLALAGLTGVAACGPAPAPVPRPSATRTATPSPRPSGLDLPALGRALGGRLVVPGDPAYASAARPFNSALGTRRPAAIAKAANADDVAVCVRLAGGRGVPLAARSGGHSYAGWSTPDGGVVVDLAGLGAVKVAADGIATVGAGARLIDVYSALAAAGRALPAGSCPTVGIGGSTLGGGIGLLARAYGLTCDHVRSMRVVTADGEQLTADAHRDAELFWALRGGGGGNAAIVTEFTFTTVPAPTVTAFSLTFPAARTARVLRAWSDWVDAAPGALTALCSVTGAAVPVNRVSGAWAGQPGKLDPLLGDLISAVGAAPSRRSTTTYGYLDAMRYFAGCSAMSAAACEPAWVPGGTLAQESFRAASRMLDGKLDDEAAAKVVALMARQRTMVLLFDSLRAAVADPAPDETAFVHRRAFASVQIYSGSAAANPAVIRVQRDLAPIVGRGAYVNYLNEDQPDWAEAYYGANLARLRRVARHYDPDGVFAFPQSVLRA